tara:strand:- start:152 stop:622 length:471 start_codon:yes stop_codon:yes gene_type:complete
VVVEVQTLQLLVNQAVQAVAEMVTKEIQVQVMDKVFKVNNQVNQAITDLVVTVLQELQVTDIQEVAEAVAAQVRMLQMKSAQLVNHIQFQVQQYSTQVAVLVVTVVAVVLPMSDKVVAAKEQVQVQVLTEQPIVAEAAVAVLTQVQEKVVPVVKVS